MRIYKNDIIKASAISTGADRGVLLPMILAAMCGDDAFVLNTKRGKGMQSTADPRHFFSQEYDEMFLGPEDLKEFEKKIIERKSDSGYDVTILLNMYLTLAFVKEFGFKAGEAWSEITEISQKQNYAQC